MKKYTFINAMVLSAALSGNVLADLNDGLVAYYPFNGNAKDESGNGNDGTVNGATLTEDRFGKKESAYSFDGVDDVILANNPFALTTTNTTPLSVSVWINTSSKKGTAPIVTKHTHCSGNNDDHFNITLYGPSTFNQLMAQVQGIAKVPSAMVSDGKWHNLTLVYDQDKYTSIYVDGEIQNSVYALPTSNWISSIKVAIGGFVSSSCSGNYNFLGIIDDTRIYNRALSESEIQQLYKAEEEKPPIEISSKAIYDSKTNTLSLEGILVPYIDEFTGKATDNKGIFDVQLQEKTKLVFELIPWSINFKGMLEGKNTSGYILYDYKTRTVEIPCFEVMTIAKLGDGIEGKAVYYKDVSMKQRNVDDLIFHVEDTTKADSCK